MNLKDELRIIVKYMLPELELEDIIVRENYVDALELINNEYTQQRFNELAIETVRKSALWRAYYGGYTKARKHHKDNNYAESKYEIGQCFEGWINAPENRGLKNKE